MTGRSAPLRRTLRESFARDLLTDWIPDALGAAEAKRWIGIEHVPLDVPLEIGRLRVPLSHRVEVVAVLPATARARLHLVVEHALYRVRLRSPVQGHRSASTRYRVAHRAYRNRLRALSTRSDLPLVVSLDVHRFGASLRPAALAGAPWMTEDLASALDELSAATGAGCLLPEHQWANRLGSAALAPVDDVVEGIAPGRWLRWGDEWLAFVPDEAAAARVREAVAVALSALGLRLSEEKSQVRPAESMADTARDVAGEPTQVWWAGLNAGDQRALRYALPRLLPNDAVTRALPEAVRRWPRLLPRAMVYLDRALGTGTGEETTRKLLDPAVTDVFATARLLALAGRHQKAASWPDDSLLIAAGSARITAVRDLAARVAALSGRLGLVTDASPSLLRWISLGARVRDRPPSVATLL